MIAMPRHRLAGYRRSSPPAATPFSVCGRHLLTKYRGKESAQMPAAACAFGISLCVSNSARGRSLIWFAIGISSVRAAAREPRPANSPNLDQTTSASPVRGRGRPVGRRYGRRCTRNSAAKEIRYCVNCLTSHQRAGP
jgi:hypothetical protein